MMQFGAQSSDREPRGGERREESTGTAAAAARALRGQDCEAYVEGKEQDYLKTLSEALQRGLWSEAYAKLRREHAASPSFFLYSAGLLLEHDPNSADAAARICTNCLENNLQDIQMMR